MKKKNYLESCGDKILTSLIARFSIFHKNFATAKDKIGWFHIDKNGNELYHERYLAIEPYYNGFALVTRFNTQKAVIDESGVEILNI